MLFREACELLHDLIAFFEYQSEGFLLCVMEQLAFHGDLLWATICWRSRLRSCRFFMMLPKSALAASLSHGSREAHPTNGLLLMVRARREL
jgi:hypothetical protein